MGRVGNDDIRLRHFLHHACHCHLALLLPDLPLDLRISFGLLHFIFDFLLCHFEILCGLPFLIAIVHQRHNHNDTNDDECHVENNLCHKGKARRQIEEHELRHRKNLLMNKAIKEKADDEDLKK